MIASVKMDMAQPVLKPEEKTPRRGDGTGLSHRSGKNPLSHGTVENEVYAIITPHNL